MNVRGGSVVAVVAAIAVGGCRSGAEPAGSPEPRRCDLGLAAPAGFEITGSIEDPSVRHTGVRVDLRAEDGRELHYFAGIPGEFGEGLPPHGTVALADGSKARLFGRDGTWVLAWERDDACAPSVVLGTGMDARGFREAMRDAGALPPR